MCIDFLFPTTQPLDPLLKLSRWGLVIKLQTNKADALSMLSEVKTDFTVPQFQYAFNTMNGKANIILFSQKPPKN